jgi:exonuclease-1
VLKHLKFSGVLIDQQYQQGFHRAVLTFQHHRVYDPAKSEMVHLTDVPSELDSDLDFLGPYPPFGPHGAGNMCRQLL